MNHIYEIISGLPYRSIHDNSMIRVIHDLEPNEKPNISIFVNDIGNVLDKKGIKFEVKHIKFFSEYPTFLIYQDNENIGCIILNYGMKF